MVRPKTAVVAVLLLATWPAVADQPVARREARPRFETDDGFQRRGGVQYYFTLTTEVAPDFRPFDDVARTERFHVVMSRIEHTVERDSAFFSAARALDIDYMKAVAPDYELSSKGGGRFHAARMPSNNFTVRFLDAPALSVATEPGVAQLGQLCGEGAESVVVQKNSDFARVMGFRTAEASFTWTAHYRLEPGRTRICVVTMSYLVNLPPFFAGGEGRVHAESVREALQMISRLREYSATEQARR
jgi:hypothetical protein